MTRSSFAEEVGGDPEMVIEGIRRFLRERRRREEDQQEETPTQSIDEREETNGPEEVRTGRGSAQVSSEGGMKGVKRTRPAGKAKEKVTEAKGEHGSKGGLGSKGVQQPKKMPKEEDAEDDRVQVAPNMGAGGSHLQATLDPEEAEEEEVEEGQQRKGGQ